MPEVKNRKIVFVKTTFDNTGTFTADFNLGFEVDDMIVKSITIGGALGTVNTIRMNGVGDIFQFTGEETHDPKYVFNLAGRSLGGLQTFTVHDIAGNLHLTLTQTLIFALEFIEFHR